MMIKDCPRCGRDNPPASRFCRQCGYELFGIEPSAPNGRARPARRLRWVWLLILLALAAMWAFSWSSARRIEHRRLDYEEPHRMHDSTANEPPSTIEPADSDPVKSSKPRPGPGAD